MKNRIMLFSGFSLVLFIVGCAGTNTFHEAVRAGDTIAVATGWNHFLQRDNITVTIDDSSANPPVVYNVGDPRIKASINLYPDPLSSLVVSQATGQDMTPFAQLYAGLIDANSTAGDRDWWETVVFIDLPDPMSLGPATVTIDSLTGGESAISTFEVVPDENGLGTGGRPNSFSGKLGGLVTFNLQDEHMQSMERVDHYTVNFSGPTVPAAIELDFTHTAGVGTAHVVNPLAHVKNVSWSDDGANLKVLLLSAEGGAPGSMQDFKFYITGGITGLQFAAGGATLPGVQAFDINGNPVIAVNASIN